MSAKEFQRSIVKEDDIPLNFDKYILLGNEIEVIEFLTTLLIMSVGPMDTKLYCKFYKDLYKFYQFEEDDCMTPDEFYVCIDKSIRCICEEGHIQLPYIEKDPLEDFKDDICQDENISFEVFKQALTQQCTRLALIFQEGYQYIRTLSTLIVPNPFPVISFLQPGNLFLGKYEIIDAPQLLEEVSSIYKRKYCHALLNVKPMIGEGKELQFELIYLTGINGDKAFRQNYFREIVLKNRLRKEETNEFGELPGGILYKKISELEVTQMTLGEYFQIRDIKEIKDQDRRQIVCMSELDAISLGLKLLDELEILHNMKVIHSAINPSSVYLRGGDIAHPAFLDLELAIWDPKTILEYESEYFKQIEQDKYDTTFRDEEYLSPEHREMAEEYRKSGRCPARDIDFPCDLYSIGALIYRALTGYSPVNFSDKTVEYIHNMGNRSLFGQQECPAELSHLPISNGMVNFLVKILAKDLSHRHKVITEVKQDLNELQTNLKRIPETLMKGLEHDKVNDPDKKFSDDYLLKLEKFKIDDFCLEYLYKFIVESRIPNIRLFGNAQLPIRQLKTNTIQSLKLPNTGLCAEELRLLSFFIEINSSLREIDLSKNPLLHRHEQDTGEVDPELGNSRHEPRSFGFERFLEALSSHTEIISFEMGQVSIGPFYVEQLCKPLSLNQNLQRLNLAGCDLLAEGVGAVCATAKGLMKLRYINLSSNNIGDQGAEYVAKLIENNDNLLEIDLFRNNISRVGGESIGRALTKNFIIQKLSIGDNDIDAHEKSLILQSVMFNTQYKKLKATNERFGELGYNLMAESIKKWTENNPFVLDKLRARLNDTEDEVDKKLARILLDNQGNLNMSSLTLQYSYTPEEWSKYSDNA